MRRAVYTGMRRATLIITSMLLAVPAVAHAKAGVEFDTYPEKSQVGTPISFSVIAFRDPPPSGGSAHPVVGAHPLITFRSASGRVIRVRASKTDLNGIGYGKVAFTDKGPWTTEMHVRGVHIGSEQSSPISVGTGLTQLIPSADSHHPKAVSTPDETSGFPWVWVLSLATVGSALLVLLMRRRGRWGAA
ncbi:MAG TPA: hypothetical protein VH300_05830 [Thermoleophilaceae bacterium]|nr:hypothetical protein [Thermoleophilaceae bacterium]